MNKFVITTDSTVDLPKEYLQEKQIPIMHLTYTIDGETYPDMEGLSSKEFFDKIRTGSLPSTSQVNPEEAREIMEPFLKEGKDILHIGFSSGLSGSCNSARIAGEELSAEYPERRIHVIDSLSACMGEGLLLYKAIAQKESGKSMEEIFEWIEENKLHVCHNVTVDDLNHLHRGGRISKATAVLGTMIKIKPIIHVNEEGKLVVIGKERGRKSSLHKIVDMLAVQSRGWENDIIMITHGDCIDDAQYVAKLVREKLGVDHVMIHTIGTVIGSHTGPGVVAVFGMGEKR
ncbi:MAG: DegV family protein [Hespellia sp.]|nr:DegV family protein [Hespellia sp.]